jgi:hypothetical protein
MPTKVLVSRNVNHALYDFTMEAADATAKEWRLVSPRGLETIEFKGTWITEYTCPRERVLFAAERDANPFFHFMESLWILAGREDVAFLVNYNAGMANFSDDGHVFHAPYGFRLRQHFKRFVRLLSGPNHSTEPEYRDLDQIAETIELLKREPDTRRAVMAIWDPAVDCNVQSKDIPCNDLLMFKLRDGFLNLTVCCRSNDAIWGAYGANAVQFSVIQEFVASAIGADVGTYRQISDSMHVYTANAAWQRLRNSSYLTSWRDPYSAQHVEPYPILQHDEGWQYWLEHCDKFVRGEPWDGAPMPAFFVEVAHPLKRAWDEYKHGRKQSALVLLEKCAAADWRRACSEWIQRRS